MGKKTCHKTLIIISQKHSQLIKKFIAWLYFKFDHELNDQEPLPIDNISRLIKFNALKLTSQYSSNMEVLCKMRYTCKFQSVTQALGTTDPFDLVTNWLLETRRPPGLKSPGTLSLKHLKTNKVAETDAGPRQNGNHFTKLTPKPCEQTILHM